jgi:hypothetical protein
MQIRRWLLPLTLLALATMLPITASAAVRGSFQRTLQVNGPVDLQVLTHSGDINIHAGPDGSVNVSARIHVTNNYFFGLPIGDTHDQDVRAIEQNPPIRQTGNMVKIDYPPYRGISIDYDITVPAATHLRAETGSGNQTVRGLRSDVTLHAGSGDLELDDLNGNMHIETGSGNIRGNGVAGAFEAHAGSGDIKVALGGSGLVRTRTGSGNVEIRGVNGGLNVETGSGDVVLDGQIAGDWAIHTGSGDVSIRLPQNASYEVDLSTSSGSLTVNDPVQTTVQGRVNEGGNRHRTSGKVRNGGPSLRVSTGSGDVKID